VLKQYKHRTFEFLDLGVNLAPGERVQDGVDNQDDGHGEGGEHHVGHTAVHYVVETAEG